MITLILQKEKDVTNIFNYLVALGNLKEGQIMANEISSFIASYKPACNDEKVNKVMKEINFN